ncbi:Transgelin [Gaertneriomyces sp. JEL0708]|nr:Transgelin [Gaertneriomyces sp. JEL0708]
MSSHAERPASPLKDDPSRSSGATDAKDEEIAQLKERMADLEVVADAAVTQNELLLASESASFANEALSALGDIIRRQSMDTSAAIDDLAGGVKLPADADRPEEVLTDIAEKKRSLNQPNTEKGNELQLKHEASSDAEPALPELQPVGKPLGHATRARPHPRVKRAPASTKKVAVGKASEKDSSKSVMIGANAKKSLEETALEADGPKPTLLGISSVKLKKVSADAVPGTTNTHKAQLLDISGSSLKKVEKSDQTEQAVKPAGLGTVEKTPSVEAREIDTTQKVSRSEAKSEKTESSKTTGPTAQSEPSGKISSQAKGGKFQLPRFNRAASPDQTPSSPQQNAPPRAPSPIKSSVKAATPETAAPASPGTATAKAVGRGTLNSPHVEPTSSDDVRKKFGGVNPFAAMGGSPVITGLKKLGSTSLSRTSSHDSALNEADTNEVEIKNWIAKTVGDDPSKLADSPIHELARDGVILVRLLNALRPTQQLKINTGKLVFAKMENINNYVTATQSLGIPRQYMVSAEDIRDAKSGDLLCQNIASLRKVIEKETK